MLGAGVGSRGKMQKVSPKLKKFPGGKKIARKEMPMTMNKGDPSSHAHLYRISRGFAETRGVRAETYEGYVQSTCGVPTRYAHFKDEVMGRGNLEDVFIEEHTLGNLGNLGNLGTYHQFRTFFAAG